jgi:hypothetical protein
MSSRDRGYRGTGVRAGWTLVTLVTLGACGNSASTSGPLHKAGADKLSSVESMFTIPASLEQLDGEHFFDHPWPSDLRRDPDGSIHYAGFYNPHNAPVITQYVDTFKGLLYGFSPAAPGYLRFTGDIDPTSLPKAPPDSLPSSATLQLIDIDPTSPERGHRRLVEWFWQKEKGVYWVSDTLAVQPALGYPLLPNTRYAYVVTTGVRDTKGLAIRPSPELEEILGLAAVTDKTKAARALFAPAVAELEKDGVPAKSVAHVAFFTTNDPTAELKAVRDTVRADFPPPTVDDATWVVDPPEAEGISATPFLPQGTGTDFDVYQGWYGPAPNYQAGKIPFANFGDGGGFVFDKSGRAVLQSTFNMRFTFVVPNTTKCPMPAAGYPMVMYAHGTGGDYRSIVEEFPSIGDVLAQHCLASMGVDQIFHGVRPGAPIEYDGPNETNPDPGYQNGVELLFFNLINIVAARTNGRQSAIDVVQQARLFTDSHVSVPASVSLTKAPILFDPSRLLFFGHSQGGLNGPLFLAVDDQVRGGVLSGSGSMLTIALLEKTSPQPSVASLVKLLLGLTTTEGAELNLFHPALAMAQTLIDTLDPIHYVGDIFQHPRPGFAPKSIYQTEGTYSDGLGDSFAPPHGIEVESVALGLPRMAPGIHPVIEAEWGKIADVTIPAAGLTGNLAGGKASGVLAQWKPSCSTETVPCPDENGDGHYVVFEVPACHEQAAQFCENLAADPVGRVPAP